MVKQMIWSVLSPARQPRTLSGLTVWEGFEGHFDSGHCLRVGIDASAWMYEAIEHNNPHPAPSGEPEEIDNPELLELLRRLCHLATYPVIPIFAFERPGSLCFTNGIEYRAPDDSEQWIFTHFLEYIESFGFFWFMAAGEPKSDLAQLSQKHLIDAVMTEDYESLVFGATSVIFAPNSLTSSWDQVDVYDAHAILADPSVRLGREGLFLMSVLCGGHADPVGLRGCGPKTALLLSRTSAAGLLFEAASNLLDDHDLNDFLHHWRNEFRVLLTHDPRHELQGRHFPHLAQNVTSEFPSVKIIRRYTHPPATLPENDKRITCFEFCEPCLSKITRLCERHFYWGFDRTLIPHFRDILWPGIVLRYFIQISLDLQPRLVHERPHRATQHGWTRDIHNGLHAEQFRLLEAHATLDGPDVNPEVLGYTVELSSDTGILNVMSHGLDRMHPGSRTQALSVPSPSPFTCWIPEPIINVAMPGLVEGLLKSE